ncbi:hypothetical protein [Fusobacterium mortiferum]|uniref:Uncharacterized protein n=1 Tax=Fusobacterium mortiferum TaxID=850 RepID=A0ABS2FYR4_FUSMR|nr:MULTISPECIES: hypothetical protein [Fusobacterium]MBM6689691.1 hypothetical protein [Fusobacterium mortiferum]MBM6874100.1 hypothetical protein [Fusobacterium mortiferum]MDO5788957.1 hypothetical protein [Fusobacterium sp.]
MRPLFVFFLYFVSTLLFGDNISQEIVKVRIVVKGKNYISYAILSSTEKKNNFFIVGEKL